jgi:hypothetical protein
MDKLLPSKRDIRGWITSRVRSARHSQANGGVLPLGVVVFFIPVDLLKPLYVYPNNTPKTAPWLPWVVHRSCSPRPLFLRAVFRPFVPLRPVSSYQEQETEPENEAPKQSTSGSVHSSVHMNSKQSNGWKPGPAE